MNLIRQYFFYCSFFFIAHTTGRHHINLKLINSINSQGLTRHSRNLISLELFTPPCCELCGLQHIRTHTFKAILQHISLIVAGPLVSNCLPWSACGPARPTLQASEVACIYIHPPLPTTALELSPNISPRYPKTELSVRSRTSSHVSLTPWHPT